MGVRRIYRNYLKNNLFLKMILMFSLITILTIITLSYLMFSFMSQSIVQRELANQKKAMEGVSSYVNGKFEWMQSLLTDIYQNDALSANMSYFLQHPYQEYAEHRLDQFYKDTNFSTDVLKYLQNKLDADPDIQNLMLYSAEEQYLYTYNSNRLSKLISTNASRSYIPDIMAQETRTIAPPNVWMRKTLNQWDPRLYSIRVPVNDKYSLKNIGQLLLYFNSDGIVRALESYKPDLKGTIFVMTPDGDVMFDSSGKYYGKKFPYTDRINSLYDTGTLQHGMYLTKLTQSRGGFIVMGAAPKEEIAASYRGLRNTILLVSAICILFAILIPSLFIMNFAKRTNRIIQFTRRVKRGDLKARIRDTREDELGQISKSFNDMLDELNNYIDRVYKAEIKQKHTELTALQARINPHFLYNTLEVIRMRALSQGASDVGEMIYSLSVLFKSFVQQKTIYTMKDEVEACRMYLELFRIRYKDRFSYEIVWERDLAHAQILKMSLQPIIENYVVHGIRSDRKDNRLTITIGEEDGFIRVRVQDNGNGMTEEKLAEITEKLDREETEGESFGLRSVHERLKLQYGSEYGIELHSEPGQGTTVIVRYPGAEGQEAAHV
ncbi:sensor histidine kinase [Paenibacillus sp. 1P03SA]|uniref:sensor histidine kinase n=1 Tax=Paenibacillus sp. 1P03SA TaxID=3132294 RepID=UPI0039A01C0C